MDDISKRIKIGTNLIESKYNNWICDEKNWKRSTNLE